jgi:hypothetical protein
VIAERIEFIGFNPAVAVLPACILDKTSMAQLLASLHIIATAGKPHSICSAP